MKELYNTVRETSGDILIVAHAGVNRAIISKISGICIKDSFAYKHGYASVNILTFNGEIFKALKICADISELGKIGGIIKK
jgi:broad specificity phosphatase PhoE